MTLKNETYRYDKEEDRANDVKTHDNPNHESYWAYLKRLSLAQESIEFEEVNEPERDEEVEEIILEE